MLRHEAPAALVEIPVDMDDQQGGKLGEDVIGGNDRTPRCPRALDQAHDRLMKGFAGYQRIRPSGGIDKTGGFTYRT